MFTLTPYDYWKRMHATHHATSGNLDRRGLGDIVTLTVGEYLALSWRKRLRYRLYRHPLVMFGLGPTYLFLLQHRAPLGLMRRRLDAVAFDDVDQSGIAVVVAVLMWLIGPVPFLLIHGPIFVLSASMGVWLFYVQHQFEDTRWAHEAALDACPRRRCTALRITTCPSSCAGSAPISACTTSITSPAAFPSIACAKCCATIRNSAAISRVTLWQSLRCVNYTLWDEEAQRLISFAALRRKLQGSGATA